jgi:hypothetical protein
MHTPKPGECYVDTLAVLPSSRGKGVGTLLLSWAEGVALERSCDRMTLAVVSGNPAERLYKRTGYKVVDEGCVEKACVCVFVTAFFGRPYGICDGNWGAKMMVKPLQQEVSAIAIERT